MEHQLNQGDNLDEISSFKSTTNRYRRECTTQSRDLGLESVNVATHGLSHFRLFSPETCSLTPQTVIEKQKPLPPYISESKNTDVLSWENKLLDIIARERFYGGQWEYANSLPKSSNVQSSSARHTNVAKNVNAIKSYISCDNVKQKASKRVNELHNKKRRHQALKNVHIPTTPRNVVQENQTSIDRGSSSDLRHRSSLYFNQVLGDRGLKRPTTRRSSSIPMRDIETHEIIDRHSQKSNEKRKIPMFDNYSEVNGMKNGNINSISNYTDTSTSRRRSQSGSIICQADKVNEPITKYRVPSPDLKSVFSPYSPPAAISPKTETDSVTSIKYDGPQNSTAHHPMKPLLENSLSSKSKYFMKHDILSPLSIQQMEKTCEEKKLIYNPYYSFIPEFVSSSNSPKESQGKRKKSVVEYPTYVPRDNTDSKYTESTYQGIAQIPTYDMIVKKEPSRRDNQSEKKNHAKESKNNSEESFHSALSTYCILQNEEEKAKEKSKIEPENHQQNARVEHQCGEKSHNICDNKRFYKGTTYTTDQSTLNEYFSREERNDIDNGKEAQSFLSTQIPNNKQIGSETNIVTPYFDKYNLNENTPDEQDLYDWSHTSLETFNASIGSSHYIACPCCHDSPVLDDEMEKNFNKQVEEYTDRISKQFSAKLLTESVTSTTLSYKLHYSPDNVAVCIEGKSTANIEFHDPGTKYPQPVKNVLEMSNNDNEIDEEKKSSQEHTNSQGPICSDPGLLDPTLFQPMSHNDFSKQQKEGIGDTSKQICATKLLEPNKSLISSYENLSSLDNVTICTEIKPTKDWVPDDTNAKHNACDKKEIDRENELPEKFKNSLSNAQSHTCSSQRVLQQPIPQRTLTNESILRSPRQAAIKLGNTESSKLHSNVFQNSHNQGLQEPYPEARQQKQTSICSSPWLMHSQSTESSIKEVNKGALTQLNEGLDQTETRPDKNDNLVQNGIADERVRPASADATTNINNATDPCPLLLVSWVEPTECNTKSQADKKRSYSLLSWKQSASDTKCMTHELKNLIKHLMSTISNYISQKRTRSISSHFDNKHGSQSKMHVPEEDYVQLSPLKTANTWSNVNEAPNVDQLLRKSQSQNEEIKHSKRNDELERESRISNLEDLVCTHSLNENSQSLVCEQIQITRSHNSFEIQPLSKNNNKHNPEELFIYSEDTRKENGGIHSPTATDTVSHEPINLQLFKRNLVHSAESQYNEYIHLMDSRGSIPCYIQQKQKASSSSKTNLNSYLELSGKRTMYSWWRNKKNTRDTSNKLFDSLGMFYLASSDDDISSDNDSDLISWHD